MAQGRPACRGALDPSRGEPPFHTRSRGTLRAARGTGSGGAGDRTAIGPRPVAVHGRRVHFGRGGRGLYLRPRACRAAGRSTPAVPGRFSPFAIAPCVPPP